MNGTVTECPPAPPKRVVRFLTSEFDAYAERLGHRTDGEKARFIGCGTATMSRIKSGKQNPGPLFIAAVYTAVENAPGAETGSDFFDFSGAL
jgi:hypothetical protein